MIQNKDADTFRFALNKITLRKNYTEFICLKLYCERLNVIVIIVNVTRTAVP